MTFMVVAANHLLSRVVCICLFILHLSICKTHVLSVQVIKSEGLIYMVLEYGDIDLARLLQRHEAAQKEGGSTELDENFIRLYWQQMLQVRCSA